ncbi:sulfur transfer protein SirA [Cellvibrio sp. BR]|jgi:tRNA 2-thiouridine synthesizing protein A|uniref:sulfurtransferase TusA n=1 Tax=unclassified Cellvibrio TaxID=2624793 RepID=UPI0002600F21|nr:MULTISPECIES: sulfurtransferase TusA [unclassified Cellvibrio]EIK44624.1 sulfur transfer protein SirA [Cellvibrio sp. BR]QEY12699.1 sulfurtransferase TusA [Cellvibrio sp. KY-YJ-3]UUA74100.1 sulfurtransferase TusA [Cellvibrio sp. QJXJ]
MNLEIDKTLDTCGLLCPEPVMMLHKTMRETDSGRVIEVIATDPSTLRDIPKFCLFLGHELIEQQQTEKNYIFYIRKA